MTTKLKLMTTISILSLLSTTFASTSDLMRRRGGLKKPKPARVTGSIDVSDKGTKSKIKKGGSVKSSSYQCTRDDQDSLPFSDFMSLIENEELQVEHKPSSGELAILGGKMVNNCKDMIDYRIYSPSESKSMLNDNIGPTYLLKAEFKKDASICSNGKCKYTAHTAEAGIANGVSGDIEIEVPPTLEGYYECLKLTGVYDEDDNYQEGNVALQDLIIDGYDGADESGEIVFYSHGPVGKLDDPVYKDGKLDIGSGSCDNFQRITKSSAGKHIKSKEQTYLDKKDAEFQVVCNSKNYGHINSQIGNFSEFSDKQSSLLKIRDNLIKQAVEDLHDELRSNKDDLSELDAEKFRDVTADFHKYIIEPLRKEIAELYYKMKAASGSDKKRYEKEMDKLAKELLGYFKNGSGYLDSKDYELMKNFAAKAPLDQESWREAALNYYEGNATAVAYGRYNKARREKTKETLVNPKIADKEVDEYFKDEKKVVEMLGELAENPDKSHAKDFNNKIVNLNQAIQYNNEDLNAYIQDEQQYMYETCYNPQMYWIQDRQGCANQVMMNIEDEQYYNQQMNSQINSRISDFSSQAQMWANIEKARNGGVASNYQQPRAINGQYDFSFKPPTSSQRNTSANMNRQPGPWAQPQQYNSTYGPYQSGYRTGMQNNNYSMYSNSGQQGYVQQQGYWPGATRTPSSGLTYNGYWGASSGQQTMPSAMQPYTYSSTATGPYNFYGR